MPQRTRKPGKTVTVRDDSLAITNLKDRSELHLSLQDKSDKILWEELNRKLKLSKIKHLTVTQLTQGRNTKHDHHLRLRITFTNTVEVEDVLLVDHLLNSEGDISILPDIPYFRCNLRNIPKESHEFFRRRNIIVQGVP